MELKELAVKVNDAITAVSAAVMLDALNWKTDPARGPVRTGRADPAKGEQYAGLTMELDACEKELGKIDPAELGKALMLNISQWRDLMANGTAECAEMRAHAEGKVTTAPAGSWGKNSK